MIHPNIFKISASILLIALSHSALASEPPGEDEEFQTESVARIRGCNAGQQALLRATEARVRSRIDELVSTLGAFDLNYVRTTFITPNKRRYVDGAPENRNYEVYLSKVLSVFEQMQAATSRGINLECKDSMRESFCQKGEVIAYVLFYGSHAAQNLYLCSGYFQQNEADRIETMMHELSHYAAGTDDLALSWLDMKNPNIVRAPEDAYHIQIFSGEQTDRALKRQIWSWNWKRAEF